MSEAAQGGAERRFWAQTLAQINPGWVVHLTREASEPSSSLAAARVHVYLYDTTTAQAFSGSMSSKQFMLGAGECGDPETMHELVSTALGKPLPNVNGLDSDQDIERVKQLVMFSALYLATTQTYALVRDSMPTMDGHWLVALYRRPNALPLLRPAYLPRSGALLSQGELLGWVQQLVKRDTSDETALVYQRLQEGGGAELHPLFR